MKIQTVLPTFFLLSDLGEEPWRYVDSLCAALTLFAPEEIVPCYDSIGIYFSSPVTEEAIYSALEVAELRPSRREVRHRHIPVCYHIGLDTEDICRQLDCSIDELIKAHSSLTYRCLAMGFSPGFGYLRPLEDGLLPALWTFPRLPSPRKVVPAGSVAITGRQAAVYPHSTPGGWRLIGRTPAKIADLKNGEFLLCTGDEVTFQPINTSLFADLWEREHGEPLPAS